MVVSEGIDPSALVTKFLPRIIEFVTNPQNMGGLESLIKVIILRQFGVFKLTYSIRVLGYLFSYMKHRFAKGSTDKYMIMTASRKNAVEWGMLVWYG